MMGDYHVQFCERLRGKFPWSTHHETFNTLKNQGYHFEHNFGHGKKHLSSVFAHLMVLAFLVDQAQEIGCQQFQTALLKAERKLYFWQDMRGYFLKVRLEAWDILFGLISGKLSLKTEVVDSS